MALVALVALVARIFGFPGDDSVEKVARSDQSRPAFEESQQLPDTSQRGKLEERDPQSNKRPNLYENVNIICNSASDETYSIFYYKLFYMYILLAESKTIKNLFCS